MLQITLYSLAVLSLSIGNSLQKVSFFSNNNKPANEHSADLYHQVVFGNRVPSSLLSCAGVTSSASISLGHEALCVL